MGKQQRAPEGKTRAQGRRRKVLCLARLIDNTAFYSSQPGASHSCYFPQSHKNGLENASQSISLLSFHIVFGSQWIPLKKKNVAHVIIWEVHLESLIDKDNLEETGQILVPGSLPGRPVFVV